MLSLRGRGEIPHRRYSPRTCLQADRVKFPNRRYSPDGRSAILFALHCPDLRKIGVFHVRKCASCVRLGQIRAPQEELCKSARRRSHSRCRRAYVAKLALLTALGFRPVYGEVQPAVHVSGLPRDAVFGASRTACGGSRWDPLRECWSCS